jgi:hypothetical protein
VINNRPNGDKIVSAAALVLLEINNEPKMSLAIFRSHSGQLCLRNLSMDSGGHDLVTLLGIRQVTICVERLHPTHALASNRADEIYETELTQVGR